MEQILCPICGSAETVIFKKFDSANEHRTFQKCTACSHIFASNFSPEVLEENYSKGYYPSPDSAKITQWISINRHIWQDLCRDILKFQNNGKSILDFGAGTGGFLESFLEVSPYTKEIYAVENAENAKINLQNRFPSGKIYSTLEECSKYDFDCIVSLQCFEHLDEPSAICKNLYDRLSDDGILVITVPNRYSLRTLLLKQRDVFNIANPTHLQFFNIKSLTAMLRRCGFKKICRLASFPQNGNFHKRIITFIMRKFAISSELRFICRK